MRGIIRKLLALSVALLSAGAFAAPAFADTWVQVNRIYVAPNRDAAMLRSLRVDRFGGEDGEALASELETALSQASYDGAAYFQIVSPQRRSRFDAVDGTVSGGVATRVSEQPFDRTDKRCVERVGKACVRYQDFVTRCTRRTISLSADVRIVRNADRRLVYTVTHPRQGEVSWCEGDNYPGDPEDMIDGFLQDIAGNIVLEITPRLELQRVKILEGTTGMYPETAQRFKAAARLAGRNLGAACGEFDAIIADVPTHGSVLYDLGVCAEAEGDYQVALQTYRRAAPYLNARDSEAEKGIRRVTQTLQGMADLDARARQRGPGRPRGDDWRN